MLLLTHRALTSRNSILFRVRVGLEPLELHRPAGRKEERLKRVPCLGLVKVRSRKLLTLACGAKQSPPDRAKHWAALSLGPVEAFRLPRPIGDQERCQQRCQQQGRGLGLPRALGPGAGWRGLVQQRALHCQAQWAVQLQSARRHRHACERCHFLTKVVTPRHTVSHRVTPCHAVSHRAALLARIIQGTAHAATRDDSIAGRGGPRRTETDPTFPDGGRECSESRSRVPASPGLAQPGPAAGRSAAASA